MKKLNKWFDKYIARPTIILVSSVSTAWFGAILSPHTEEIEQYLIDKLGPELVEASIGLAFAGWMTFSALALYFTVRSYFTGTITIYSSTNNRNDDEEFI